MDIYFNIFITPTFDNFLMKFCGDDLLIIEIISAKFRKKNYSIVQISNYTPLDEIEWGNGGEPNPIFTI